MTSPLMSDYWVINWIIHQMIHSKWLIHLEMKQVANFIYVLEVCYPTRARRVPKYFRVGFWLMFNE